MRTTRLVLIGSFLLLIALPGLQMRYRFAPEVSLSGVRNEPTKPRYTLTSWLRGDFQHEAEAWFDDHIGFRGHAVRTDNQIGLSLLHEASSKAADAVVLGRRMMVYGDGYVTAYDGEDPFPDRKLRKVAARLRQVQEALRRRGIAFVLLISPNKAAIYPEYIPPGFVHPNASRPPTAYERMLPMLEGEGVNVVDGHAILDAAKAASVHAVFPPGGIHWNRYGAFLVLRQAWQALEGQLGRPLVELRCLGLAEDDAPSQEDQETDAADLLNAWRVGHADWTFPRPQLVAHDRGGAFRPKLVVVGDSFWTLPASIIADHGMVSRNDFYYYFNELGRSRAPNDSEAADFRQGMTWEHVLSADAIIVEANEIMIGNAGYGFVEKALEALGGERTKRGKT